MKFDEQMANDLDRLLRWRRNEVEFSDRPVAPAELNQLLASAHCAPSVGLSQPWKYVVVQDQARRQSVVDNFAAARQREQNEIDPALQGAYARLKLTGLVSAPVHVAFFLDNTENRGHGLGYSQAPLALNYSVAISAFCFWMAAQARNISVGWVSVLDDQSVNEILDVEQDWALVAYLCVGYALQSRTEPDLEANGWSRRLAEDGFVLFR